MMPDCGILDPGKRNWDAHGAERFHPFLVSIVHHTNHRSSFQTSGIPPLQVFLRMSH